MTLKVYNTLTGKKEKFLPLKKKEVRMYVCGVTVYDDCHLGHARCYVAFDVIYRYLRYKGYKVRYIQNITDVDDKIIAKAKQLQSKVQSQGFEGSGKKSSGEIYQRIFQMDGLPEDKEGCSLS